MKKDIHNSTKLKSRRHFDDVLPDIWWLRSANDSDYCEDIDYANGYVTDDGIIYSYGYNICNHNILIACVI